MTPDNVKLLIKLLFSCLLFAGLFYLAVIGKIPASGYETLVIGALGAFGGYHANKNKGDGQ